MQSPKHISSSAIQVKSLQLQVFSKRNTWGVFTGGRINMKMLEAKCTDLNKQIETYLKELELVD